MLSDSFEEPVSSSWSQSRQIPRSTYLPRKVDSFALEVVEELARKGGKRGYSGMRQKLTRSREAGVNDLSTRRRRRRRLSWLGSSQVRPSLLSQGMRTN